MFRNITNVDFSGRFHPQNNSHNCKKHLTSNPVCHELQLLLLQSLSFSFNLLIVTFPYSYLSIVYLVQSHCLNFILFPLPPSTSVNFILPLIPSFRIVVQLPDSSRSPFSSLSRPTPPSSLPKICPIRTFGSSGFSSLVCSTISIRQRSSRHTPSAPNWPTTAGKLSGLFIFERK